MAIIPVDLDPNRTSWHIHFIRFLSRSEFSPDMQNLIMIDIVQNTLLFIEHQTHLRRVSIYPIITGLIGSFFREYIHSTIGTLFDKGV